MILGTHNSFTYLRATSLLQRIISSTWRCQRTDIQTQYALGARCFDFRLHYKKDRWQAAHGGARFNAPFEATLRWLADRSSELNRVYVRTVYESGDKGGKEAFKALCSSWRNQYPSITFFEGRGKDGWEPLYEYPFKPRVEQYVSSMQESSALKKIQPKRYAEKHNKANYAEALKLPAERICLFDFVDIDCRPAPRWVSAGLLSIRPAQGPMKPDSTVAEKPGLEKL